MTHPPGNLAATDCPTRSQAVPVTPARRALGRAGRVARRAAIAIVQAGVALMTAGAAPAAAQSASAPPVAPLGEPVVPASGGATLARPARILATDIACRPEYPAAAVKAMATGRTSLRFYVDATGRVTAAEIIRSAGDTREHRLLDAAARKALATCRFVPGVNEKGMPVGSVIDVNYEWRLD